MEHRRDLVAIVIFVLFIGLTIGYAYLNSSLAIHGAGRINNPTWGVHFDNIQVQDGSVEGEYVIQGATIDDDTSLSFQVRLSKPGDYYDFLVDVVNDGTIDAMIEAIESTLNDEVIDDLPAYLKYEVTYEDGAEITPNQLLASGRTETLKVHLEYSKDINKEELPNIPKRLRIGVRVPYIQKGPIATPVFHPGSLYSVMETKYFDDSPYVEEYTGPHKDSFLQDGRYSIYYWNAVDRTSTTSVASQANVAFGNHCWLINRTTDTGGVRLVYNGELVDGQCLSTRPKHVGYDNVTTTSLSDTYYYGTDYYYDSGSGTFSLAGNVTTGEIKTEVYTCKATSADGTCATLLYITRKGSYSYEAIQLTGNADNYSFGKSPYNRSEASIAYIGYMYNTAFSSGYKSFGYRSINSCSGWNPVLIDIPNHTEYYYADEIEVTTDENNRVIYNLVNAQQVGDMSDYSELIGKYVLTSGTTSSQGIAYYIIQVDSNNQLIYHKLENGDTVVSMYMGDSYIDNGDGTYTIVDPEFFPFERWMTDVDHLGNNAINYNGKYLCEGTSPTCTNIRHINRNTHYGYYEYFGIDNSKELFASDIRYEDGKYYLAGEIVEGWDFTGSDAREIFDYHHYTCYNNTTECTSVKYVTSMQEDAGGWRINYLSLTNGNDISTAIQKMFFDENVNVKSSDMKYALEAWYEKYMVEYDSYIEDTIFCNDRSIKDLGSFDPNGGNISSYAWIRFVDGERSTFNMECSHITDQFSIYNDKAPLKYKVGMLTAPELLLSRYEYYSGTTSFLIGSPVWLSNKPIMNISTSMGFATGGYVTSNYSVRPVITLNHDALYMRGDGSAENPYYVGSVHQIHCNTDLFPIPSDSPVGYPIIFHSDDYIVTSFRLNGELIEGDRFYMPDEEVTITDVQYIPAYYSISTDDDSLDLPDMGRYLETYKLTTDGYRVLSFDLNGEHIVGNTFVMPSNNVTITNVVKQEQTIVESEHNPYPNSINNVVYYENTFEGATSLEVEITYQTEGTSWDWVSLYTNTGTSAFKTLGGNTKKTDIFTINGNYIRIQFRTDGSGNNYYGFKAAITPFYSG